MPPMNEQELSEILEPLIDRGMAEMSGGHFEKAIRTFRRCIGLAPLRQDVRDLLAMALDNKAPAELEQERDDDDWDDVEELVDESEPSTELKVQPKKSHVQLPGWLMVMTVLLCILAVSGIWGFKAYRPEIEAFIERFKTLGKPEHVVLANNYYNDAVKRRAQREYLEAITLLDQAIDTNPAEGATYGALKAVIYLDLGDEELEEDDYKDALSSYEKAVDADPNSADALFNVGFVLHEMALDARRRGNSHDEYFEQSADALEQTLEMNPEYIQAMSLLMQDYAKLDYRTDTCNICWDIIEKFPEHEAATAARRILANYGLSERRQGRSTSTSSAKTPPAPNPSGH